MTFENLMKLNSHVAEGFMLNKIISLLKKEIDNIQESHEIILDNAVEYITLIKNGKKFLEKKTKVNDLEKSLTTYNNALQALIEADKHLNLEKFQEIIITSENQINNAIRARAIHSSDMNQAIVLFEAIREGILKKANELSLLFL